MKSLPSKRTRDDASRFLRMVADQALRFPRHQVRAWRDSDAWSGPVHVTTNTAYGFAYEALRLVFVEHLKALWSSWMFDVTYLHPHDMAEVALEAAALLEDGWLPGRPLHTNRRRR